MGVNSKISWTDDTFNPWRGCTKVSPGCKFCYAEKQSARNPAVLGNWGPKGARVLASESYWQQPVAWNKTAERNGVRRRVFCSSLADVFEGSATMPEASYAGVAGARKRLWELIENTPWLDWLLLTKRPENIRYYAPARWLQFGFPCNVWIGVSVEDQATADERLPHLLRVPSVVRFVSYEPALGPVNFGQAYRAFVSTVQSWTPSTFLGHLNECYTCDAGRTPSGCFNCSECHGTCIRSIEKIDWLIVGGESGPNARPFHLEWAMSTIDQAIRGNAAVFVKQLGAVPILDLPGQSFFWNNDFHDGGMRLRLTDPKGGNPNEWPLELNVQQFPTPRVLSR